MAFRDAKVLLAQKRRGGEQRFRLGLGLIHALGGGVGALQRRCVDRYEACGRERFAEGADLLGTREYASSQTGGLWLTAIPTKELWSDDGT